MDQPIQSVAVHLLTLYRVLERGVSPDNALWYDGRRSGSIAKRSVTVFSGSWHPPFQERSPLLTSSRHQLHWNEQASRSNTSELFGRNGQGCTTLPLPTGTISLSSRNNREPHGSVRLQYNEVTTSGIQHTTDHTILSLQGSGPKQQ